MLNDLDPERRRSVVRNGVREGFAIIVLAIGFALWVGMLTNVPYVDPGPYQKLVLDTVAALSLFAAGFLVWGKRAFEEGMEVVKKLRGG